MKRTGGDQLIWEEGEHRSLGGASKCRLWLRDCSRPSDCSSYNSGELGSTHSSPILSTGKPKKLLPGASAMTCASRGGRRKLTKGESEGHVETNSAIVAVSGKSWQLFDSTHIERRS